MTDTPSFKTGDIVRLKSGGPKMTVDTALVGRVDVCWIEGRGAKSKLHQRVIPNGELELLEA